MLVISPAVEKIKQGSEIGNFSNGVEWLMYSTGLLVKASLRRWHLNKNLKEMKISVYGIYQVEATNCKFSGPEVGVCLVTPGTDHRDLKVIVNT